MTAYVSLERKPLAENSTVYVQFLDNQMLLTGVRLNSPSHICNHVDATELQPLNSLAYASMTCMFNDVDVIRVDLSRSARDLA